MALLFLLLLLFLNEIDISCKYYSNFLFLQLPLTDVFHTLHFVVYSNFPYFSFFFFLNLSVGGGGGGEGEVEGGKKQKCRKNYKC